MGGIRSEVRKSRKPEKRSCRESYERDNKGGRSGIRGGQ